MPEEFHDIFGNRVEGGSADLEFPGGFRSENQVEALDFIRMFGEKRDSGSLADLMVGDATADAGEGPLGGADLPVRDGDLALGAGPPPLRPGGGLLRFGEVGSPEVASGQEGAPVAAGGHECVGR